MADRLRLAAPEVLMYNPGRHGKRLGLCQPGGYKGWRKRRWAI